jgi:hypothetical protein
MKKDTILLGLLTICLTAFMVIMVILVYKIATKPDKLESNHDIPPMMDFSNTETVVEDTTVDYTDVTVDEPVVETEGVSVNNALEPTDAMIYAAMDYVGYKDLCKAFDTDLRVGIIDVKDAGTEGIVVTFIIDNTDATFKSKSLNNTTSFSPIVNKLGEQYPIVYFEDGVPKYSHKIYGYLGNSYTDRTMVAEYVSETEFTLRDTLTDELVDGFID